MRYRLLLSLFLVPATLQAQESFRIVVANHTRSPGTDPSPLFRAGNLQNDEALDLEHSSLEKVGYLLGASVAFSLFDYVGYNASKGSDGLAPPAYRVLQLAVQGGLTYFLYEECGLPTAIGFNLIWWTFGDDLLYYGWAELLNPGGLWEGRGALDRAVLKHGAGHAYWTPVGIARGFRRDGSRISGDTLVAQSLVGAALAITITVTW